VIVCWVIAEFNGWTLLARFFLFHCNDLLAVDRLLLLGCGKQAGELL